MYEIKKSQPERYSLKPVLSGGKNIRWSMEDAVLKTPARRSHTFQSSLLNRIHRRQSIPFWQHFVAL